MGSTYESLLEDLVDLRRFRDNRDNQIEQLFFIVQSILEKLRDAEKER